MTARVRQTDFLDGARGPFSCFSSVQWNDEEVRRRASLSFCGPLVGPLTGVCRHILN